MRRFFYLSNANADRLEHIHIIDVHNVMRIMVATTSKKLTSTEVSPY